VATPLIAAITADRNVGCDTPTGNFAPELYALAGHGVYGTALNEITSGNNDLTRTYGGADFPATPGDNLAIGLGSPEATGLTCAEITGVSAATAVPGSTVTVIGLGLEDATILFGATPATVLSREGDSTVTVTVPPGSGLLHVSASSPAGAGTQTSRSATRP
jgi:hypothetical protein